MRHYLILCSLLVSTSVLAEVTESLVYHTYDVEQAANTSLLEAINRVTPVRQDGKIFHGNTSWYVKWRYRWNEQADGSCTISKSTVTVTGKITLPNLISSDDEPSKSEFARYIVALKEHELGHYQIAKDIAKEIDDGILSLPTMDSCANLEKTANKLGYELLNQARADERNYDKETGHGRTQGAWLER